VALTKPAAALTNAGRSTTVAAHPISLANLFGLAILPYDSSQADWRDDLLHGLGKLILQAQLQVARGEASP
jgi:hypothetical protein